MVTMHRLFFVISLSSTWDWDASVLAFQASLQQPSRQGFCQRRAQPLILDTFDCDELVPLFRNTSTTWLPSYQDFEQFQIASVYKPFNSNASGPSPGLRADVDRSRTDDQCDDNTSWMNGFQHSTFNDTQSQSSIEGGDLVCRVIARSDGKFPPAEEIVPLLGNHDVLEHLDDIYHAQAHQETRRLKYMQRYSKPRNSDDTVCDLEEEKQLVTTVRHSLEDAGFELLSRRDLDLCEALNAGYLLRLSILPDVTKLDEGIAKEFFPERFNPDGKPRDEHVDEFLFDQRVLVFWRGYSKEITRGRLLLPKLDYLQASLVQRLFGNIRDQLGRLERNVAITALASYRKATACFLFYTRHVADQVPNERLSKSLRKMMRSPYFYSAFKVLNNGTLPSVSKLKAASTKRGNVFKLSRYGGSKTKFVGSPNPRDALNPFIICEEKVTSCPDELSDESRVQRVDRVMYESLTHNEVCCPYDANVSCLPPMQLLERVSISNLVDIFTKEGRRNLVKTMFSRSALVEPTFEEVVVVWRPLLDKTDTVKFTPPKIAYELADMFDIEGLPKIVSKKPESLKVSPLQIRTFEEVPMANLPAVLPQTKLVFRPADAFVFDLISILSFVAIAGSIRFDNPKLDLIALVSVGLWLFRTVLRYSNKLARYDLLVKKFLTSKISHRNAGALKYLATEAGSQRAMRAMLVQTWLSTTSVSPFHTPSEGDKGVVGPLLRSQLIDKGQRELHALMKAIKCTPVDIDAALNDLEHLQLVRRLDSDGELLEVVRDGSSVVQVLKRAWSSLFTRVSANTKDLTRHRPKATVLFGSSKNL
jgi:Protein of unknown function (DUF3754)